MKATAPIPRVARLLALAIRFEGLFSLGAKLRPLWEVWTSARSLTA